MILTLSIHIKRPLKDYTLLQATDILKAVSLGILLQLGLSNITFMGWQSIRLIPTLLLYRHLNQLGKHIPLNARIH
jgi:hypothetical protein